MRKIDRNTNLTEAHAGPGDACWIDGVTYLPDAPSEGPDPHAGTIRYAKHENRTRTDAGLTNPPSPPPAWTVTPDVTKPAGWDETVEALRHGDVRALAVLAQPSGR